MKTFLCSLTLLAIGLSQAPAEDTKTLVQQAEEIGAKVERLAGTAPAKPVVTVGKDEVVIHSSDLDQAKDAIVELRPEDSTKPIRIRVAPMKRAMENGRPVIYVSYGKPLSGEFRDALGTLAERSHELILARQANPTDIRGHIDVAERVLGLEAKNLPLSERTYRITWMASFDRVQQDITFEFE